MSKSKARPVNTLHPSDWNREDIEPWYQHGTAKIDGVNKSGEAEFRNTSTKEVIVYIPGPPFDPGERYVIAEADFTAGNFPQDKTMAEIMRRALRGE
jgi:hypothetical protein